MRKDEKNKWLYVVTQQTNRRVTSTPLHTRLVVMDATQSAHVQAFLAESYNHNSYQTSIIVFPNRCQSEPFNYFRYYEKFSCYSLVPNTTPGSKKFIMALNQLRKEVTCPVYGSKQLDQESNSKQKNMPLEYHILVKCFQKTQIL